ncbi:tetratricopeptide repeat protein [Spirosoma gilvum]
MNKDLETIENYVNGQLSPADRAAFEQALHDDPAVAEALAFYLLTWQAVKADVQQPLQSADRDQRRAELNALRKKSQSISTDDLVGGEIVRQLAPSRSFPMRWVAAASIVLLLGLGWYFLSPKSSGADARQLADQYVNEHFMQLPTTMDGGSSGSPTIDSLKMGIGLFNKGQLAEADAVFQQVLSRQPNSDSALKYAGIVSLRQQKYDQAITYFHRLSEHTDLFANPGTFYEALTYLKRNQPLDKVKAKELFEEVITRNLEGKADAEPIITTISH